MLSGTGKPSKTHISGPTRDAGFQDKVGRELPALKVQFSGGPHTSKRLPSSVRTPQYPPFHINLEEQSKRNSCQGLPWGWFWQDS